MSRNIEDIFKMNGCSNHCAEEREEHDFYSTDPECVKQLLEKEQFAKTILEPCCGTGNISETLKEAGYEVISTDLIDRGYGIGGVDFFKTYKDIDVDIITNPPYGLATEFVVHALKELKPHRKMALFLKLNFLEGVQRYNEIFSAKKYLKTVYVYSKRVACYKNDERYQKDKDGKLILDAKGNPKKIGSAVAFCWLVFDTDFEGNPTIDWINTEEYREHKKAYRKTHPEVDAKCAANYKAKHKDDPEYKRKHAEANKRWLEKKKQQAKNC